MTTESDSNAPRLGIATYNVHSCVGTDRRRSESRIAEVIASLGVDIIGLQELDRHRARSGGLDQAELIAQELGWHHVFAPALRRGTEEYGNAILSRYPLRLDRTCALPGKGSWYCRETRVALWAEAETPLGLAQIINTHFGLGRTERLLQAQLLTSAEWLGGIAPATPMILLGDFNSRPQSRSHRHLRSRLREVRSLLPEAGTCRTFPTRFPVVAVDHIFVNAALQPLSLRVHRSALARIASDHYPLVSELAPSVRSAQ